MPDMTDLPFAEERAHTPEEIAEIDRLRAEVEALKAEARRLTAHEANAEYWRSDEAMEND